MATAEQYAEWIVANEAKKGTPEFQTVAEAYKLSRSEESAPVSRVSEIPGVPPQPVAQPSAPRTIGERLYGAAETGLSALTAIPATVAGAYAGAGSMLAGGNPNDTFRSVSGAMTFQPRSEVGQEYLSGLGGLLQASKLAGVSPAAGTGPGAVLAGPAAAQARAGLAQLLTREPQGMPGMGSAMTSPARIRTERAEALPVPMQLTKGQATKEFGQVQFERETAKLAGVGEPLRERYAQQNAAILTSFDDWVDQTGAQAPDLRATGQIVNSAIVEKAKKAKGAIDAAYTQARASGEMAAPIDIEPLLQYAQKNRAAAGNAKVISTMESAIDDIAGPAKKDVFGQTAPRTVTLNDLEQIRSTVGTAGLKDAPNAHYAREIKGLIDGITEGAGGEAYKRARMLRYRYGKEFENVGVVDKLMSTKPGTTDRAVAYEDVFKHSILSGSLDDARAIRKTLQTAGPTGEQAWRELQGQTVLYLKNEASKNAQRDIKGNPIVSFSGFDKAVRNLDADGKLDFVFGQKGAQQIRDMRDLSADVFTTPPGAVNTSNTNSAFWTLLHSLPGARTLRVAKDLWGSRGTRQRVQESLTPPAP